MAIPDNSKLFYCLELTQRQHEELVKVIQENPSLDSTLQATCRNNPFTGHQAPIINKLMRQYLAEVIQAPFWFYYNLWKYPN